MDGTLQFRSWGFDLYVPREPFSQKPERPRFVMLDDLENVFYDVDYETAKLGNTTSWTDLALHTVKDPAIVFLPEEQDMLHKMKFATGLLVSIESETEEGIIYARKLGRVNISPLPTDMMSWGALRGLKGQELPREMRAGLLRHVWRKGTLRASHQPPPFELKTPASITNSMESTKAIGPPSRWNVSGLGQDEISRSIKRAEYFVEK